MIAKKFLQVLAFAIVVAAVVFSLTGCGKGGTDAPPPPPPPPLVTVAPVLQKEVTEWDEFTGRTEAVESVEVRPRVSGHIREVRFQSGQLVRKGEVLFVIDPRYYKAEFDRRQAESEQAQVRVANAERDAKRPGRLLASKAISSEEGDADESQFQEAKAGVLAAKAVLETARLDYEFTQVRAPIDGRVSRALLTTGNYVSGLAGGASLLTTIVSVNPIYVYADVDENSLLRFNALAKERAAAGETKVPVELALGDDQGFPARGVIESFDNRVNANTGTIVVRAEFANPEGRIVPGLFARIRIPMSGRHEALLVDEASIGTDQAQKFVLTIGKDNMVEYRAVKLGPVIDGKRVVRSGLKPGEKIIVNGLQRARPGTPVTPQEAVAGAEAAGPKTARR